MFLTKGKNSLMDVIRCDEPSYLIWKWRPAGSYEGNNNRENAIRWGSSIRIKDGEAAIFVCGLQHKSYQEYIVGPYDGILKTENLPIIADAVSLAYGGDSPFPAEVYFVNLAQIIQSKFAVPFFDVFDPRFTDYSVPVAVRGTISFRIADMSNFIKLHRLQNFSVEDFRKQICDVVCRYVKDTVANTPAAHNIPVVQLESKTAQINNAVEYDLSERLKDRFGVIVSGIDIGAIEIDKSSDGYQQLMAVTKDVATARVTAENSDYIERLRIQREEAQYTLHKQTQSANIGAFQVEKKAEIGVAGANALGRMGEKDAGRIDLGGGAGFNPASMMAGITLGGAVGQSIAGAMNGVLAGASQPAIAAVPPPIPATAYYVAVDGQATGPFGIETLQQMAMSRQLTPESLVWKAGMSQWEKAGIIDELKDVLVTMPPIPST